MKKLWKGISNYEDLVDENYYYVDKTKYIEKLEDLPDKTIMFLRPRKFGKTLFTSVLENYYDLLKLCLQLWKWCHIRRPYLLCGSGQILQKESH